MALFRHAGLFDIPLPVLTGESVILRAPHMTDFPEWAYLRQESRAFLTPWEPVWPAEDLTRNAFRLRLKHYAQDVREDAAYPFLIFRTKDLVLLGGMTLAHVRRGVSQAVSLGYWIGKPYARQGYMTAAARLLVPYVFDVLKLRRIEAACIPTNEASMRLLERVGFFREGYARQYLCINGTWEDHLLYALLKEDGFPR